MILGQVRARFSAYVLARFLLGCSAAAFRLADRWWPYSWIGAAANFDFDRNQWGNVLDFS
jgi:hypothetical protein